MASLTALARQILAAVEDFDETLAQMDVKSDDAERYCEPSKELDVARDNIINECARMRSMLETPEVALRNIYLNWTELLSLRVICHFKFFDHIPSTGSATYKDIAAQSNVPEDVANRIIRMGFTNGIFTETSPGLVGHTPRSRWLARNPGLLDLVAFLCEDMAPAATQYVDAIEKWGDTQEPEHSAFTLANGGELSFFAVMTQDAQRRLRFGRSMQYMTSSDSWDLNHVRAGFDWAGVDRPGARVLDVGGGLGHLSAFLAKNTVHLHFTVQDLAPVVADAERVKQNLLPAEASERVSFVEQNFFEPQRSTQKADVVVMRWILHDWSDKYAVKILENLVPVMKRGTKIVLVEWVLADAPVTNATDGFGLRLDMIMGVGLNAKERTTKQFRELLARADKRYVLKRIERPASSSLSVIEVGWDG